MTQVQTTGAPEAAVAAGEARSRLFGAVAAVLVFAVVAFALRKLASEISYDEVAEALNAIAPGTFFLSCLLAAASYGALTLYDVSALRYAGAPRPYRAVWLVAFCAYAVGNTAGFGPLSGGAIRYRFYSRLGLDPMAIAKVISFVTAAFGIGLLFTTLLALTLAAPRLAPLLGWPEAPLRWTAAVALLGAAALGALALRRGVFPVRRFRLVMPAPRLAIGQLLVTAADIAISAGVLYVLLPHTGLGYPAFVAIYAVAVGLGVLSHVPAGLGVFETVILGALGSISSAPEVVSALVVYRFVYHVLPLAVAAVLAGLVETRQAIGPEGSRIRSASGRVAPIVVAALAVIAGLVLVLSSVTPAADEGPNWRVSFLPVIEIGHFASGVLGLWLVVVGRGLAQRLDGAWWASTIVAVLLLGLGTLGALELDETVLVAFLLFALLTTRRLYKRPASLLRQALTGPWLAAIAIVVISAGGLLFFAYSDVDYANDLWLQFELSGDAPRSLRAFVGIATLACATALWSLVRAAPAALPIPSEDDLERARRIVDGQNTSDANLVRCADKSILFSPDGDAFLMYGRHGRSWIALYEPFGAPAARSDLVWSFIEMARASDGRAAFYEVSPEALPLCADAGLLAIKLGEVAIVDLDDFELKGPRRANLRQTFNRGNRDGFSFELVPPEGVPAILPELRAVSDAWLTTRNAREKRFSVGSFTDAYILQQPIGLLRHEGRIVAFANLLLTQTRAEASIDLMRYTQEAPRQAMEYLFVRLMLELRERGYRTFNLGMAPLSGLGRRAAAPVWQHLGRLVFERGGRFYNFQGLRAFKNKFDPRWEPRYLAVQGGLAPAIALADASALIAGGVKGVVSR